MKKHLFILLFFLCPLFAFSQNVGIGTTSPSEKLEVNGNLKVAGIISGVSDPISAQDAATKAYVDLLESTIDALESKVSVLFNFLNLSVQQRLDAGETPTSIYNSDNSLLDSLYGKTYQGGLIFYLDTIDGNGLVAAPVDQSSGAEWGCIGTLIGTSDSIGSGQANTTLIVDGCAESGIAARLCDDLVYDGYDDWFSPSKNELNEMYIKLKLNDFGGFSSDYYWSSTENNDNYAWEQSFGYDNQSSSTKNYGNNNVRAVRAF